MEFRQVRRRAALVGALNGLSRVLGLVREILTARLFGTSIEQSAFVVAFTVPNLFRRLFGEGALSAAFVPAFADSLTHESQADALRMARRLLTRVATVLGLVAALGALGTLLLAPWVEPGGRTALTLPLLRIMLPYAPLICLAALSMGMLNVLGDFRTPALAPSLLNLIWIGVLLGVAPHLGPAAWPRVVAVAWGIVLAGFAQFLYQRNALRRRGFPLAADFGGGRDARVRAIWRQALPAALGAGAVQINVCLDFLLAFWAADWAPSALTYAERVLYLPLGLVATPFSTVLLPTFSKQFAVRDLDGLRRTLGGALTDLSLLMIPAAVGLAALAAPIVSVLYERGEFDAQATLRTARALACYAPGLFVFGLHKALHPLFYGMRDTRTPMRLAAATVVLNLVLNVLFVVTWPEEWKHAGIAVSTVISSALASCILAWLAVRRVGDPGWRRIAGVVGRATLAAAVMAGAARWTHHGLLRLLVGSARAGTGRQALALIGAISVGAAVYAAGLMVLSPREARRVARTLGRRLGRKAS